MCDLNTRYSSDEVKQLLNAYKISQKELIEKAHISKATMWRFLDGNGVHDYTVRKITNAMQELIFERKKEEEKGLDYKIMHNPPVEKKTHKVHIIKTDNTGTGTETLFQEDLTDHEFDILCRVFKAIRKDIIVDNIIGFHGLDIPTGVTVNAEGKCYQEVQNVVTGKISEKEIDISEVESFLKEVVK